MIPALRRKFMTAAMISLSILILILTGGAALFGYVRMEQAAEEELRVLKEERRPPKPEGAPPRPLFGYEIRENSLPVAFLIAGIDPGGQIDFLEYRGMMELTEEEAKELVRDALAQGKEEGKAGSCKYAVARREDGSLRMVFLDMSLPIRTLRNTVFSLFLTGLGCTALLAVILFFVSGRVIRPLAENMEKQRQFVSNAGHEMKTPLGIMMANTDALELHLGESRWSRNIRSQTERMHRLMEGLLLLARMDEGAEVLSREAVDLGGMVEKKAAEFLELAGKRQMKLQVIKAERVILSGDPGYLEQLADILFDNAVKYGSSGSQVEVRLERKGRVCRLSVENQVEALPEVPPDTLFDRFYRANAARTQKEGGCGIGLSAARAIVRMHGGQIRASYVEGCRVRFLAELPVRSPGEEKIQNFT